MSLSLEATEKEAGANATAPRVSLADIEAAIWARYDMLGDEVVRSMLGDEVVRSTHPHVISKAEAKALGVLSVCILHMQNGFIVIGKSAPASAENFNADLGRKLAYEDAVRQLWPLMGFALRDRLARKS